MSNICSFIMENTHNNVEFGVLGVLQKTSKQILFLIFFQMGAFIVGQKILISYMYEYLFCQQNASYDQVEH